MRSFLLKVDSPDAIRQDISQFARCHTTLYNLVNIPSEMLFYLPLYSTCAVSLSMLIPFFHIERMINTLQLN